MVEHNVENLDNIFRTLFDLIISEIVRLNASHDFTISVLASTF
jgi:hypothetical protein